MNNVKAVLEQNLEAQVELPKESGAVFNGITQCTVRFKRKAMTIDMNLVNILVLLFIALSGRANDANLISVLL